MKWVKFGVSGHFPENAWREWTEILHADVSWPPSEPISLWSWSVDFFFKMALFWLSESGQIWSFLAFPGGYKEGIAWNFACCCIMATFRTDKIMVTVYWFFKIFVLFWLSGTGQILVFRAFPGECMEGIAWNFAYCCILVTFRND